MKSTYKLLGVFWDGRKVVKTNFKVCKPRNEILDYHYPYELFDVNCYARKITITELLKVNEEKEAFEIVDKLKQCNKIYAIIDCIPNVRNPILLRFVRKRILQVLNYLQESASCAKIYVDRVVLGYGKRNCEKH